MDVMNSIGTAVGVVALILAILALTIQAAVQWKIARKQLDIQLETTNRQLGTHRTIAVTGKRQQWMDGLRSDLAEFLSRIGTLCTAEDEDYEGREEDERILLMYKTRIELRLYSEDEIHEELMSLLNDVFEEIADEDNSGINFSVLDKKLDRIAEIAESIFKETWETIKEELDTGRIAPSKYPKKARAQVKA